jgi:uncharacterized phage protein (TIGR02218 family)
MANPAHVTQVAIEALIDSSVSPHARVSHAPLEVVLENSETPTARVSQGVLEVLIQAPQPPVPAEYSSGFMPTTQSHHFATLWKITREDETVFRFTDHDMELTTSDGTYTPVSSLQATARQKQSGLNDNNFAVRGIVDASVISHEDLMLGKYRGAQVTEYLVDWRYPWAGYIMATHHWIQKCVWDGEVWKAELIGVADKLKKPRGDVYSRVCRWTLGDDKCKFAISSLMDDWQTVDNIVDAHHTFKPKLTDASYSKANGYYDYGWLVWRSGNNDTMTSEIKIWDGDNHSFTLALPTVFPIEVGDKFDVVPGCAKTLDVCIGKFNNINHFGGFPAIPGPDRMLQTPKSGILGKLGFE